MLIGYIITIISRDSREAVECSLLVKILAYTVCALIWPIAIMFEVYKWMFKKDIPKK